MFRLDIEKLNWINDDGADDPRDLCAHASVKITFGENSLTAAQITASAGAIFLLRSLFEDHIPETGDTAMMLPCCGNGIYEDENNPDRAVIITCPFGFDFSVIHDSGCIRISSSDLGEINISTDEYTREVFAFADQVMAFYDRSAPKIFNNSADEKGYHAMMREWKKLRNS